MEFLRFGGTIPGECWGCCAGNIIQNFKQDPDTPASIQLVEGDSGCPITERGEAAFLGPTLRDIFWQRLRVSTFGKEDMPNQFFLAVLEESQINGDIGKKWLALLKEAGFEFLRTVDNSVYTGPELWGEASKDDYDDEFVECNYDDCREPHKNYIFGLFRNIGGGRIDDPFTPPKAWRDLPFAAPEAWTEMLSGEEESEAEITTNFKSLANDMRIHHTVIWNAHGPTKIMTESEVVAAGAPVIMAGQRTEFPPELKEKREEKMAQRKAQALPYKPSDGTQYLYPPVLSQG